MEMTSDEKVKLLVNYENKQKLTNKHLRKIIKFSDDKDVLVRSMVADLLINFESNESKKVLLKLACDKKAMVRTDAYDSLAVFKSKEVEKFLKKAILNEKDEMACAYAIMSWSDVAAALDEDILKKKSFISKLKKLPNIQKSERCMLSCYYALYVLGKKKSIKNITSFLNSKDYHIRCAVINILWGFLAPDNQQFIKKSLEILIKREDTIAVKKNALNLIKFITSSV